MPSALERIAEQGQQMNMLLIRHRLSALENQKDRDARTAAFDRELKARGKQQEKGRIHADKLARQRDQDQLDAVKEAHKEEYETEGYLDILATILRPLWKAHDLGKRHEQNVLYDLLGTIKNDSDQVDVLKRLKKRHPDIRIRQVEQEQWPFRQKMGIVDVLADGRKIYMWSDDIPRLEGDSFFDQMMAGTPEEKARMQSYVGRTVADVKGMTGIGSPDTSLGSLTRPVFDRAVSAYSSARITDWETAEALQKSRSDKWDVMIRTAKDEVLQVKNLIDKYETDMAALDPDKNAAAIRDLRAALEPLRAVHHEKARVVSDAVVLHDKALVEVNRLYTKEGPPDLDASAGFDQAYAGIVKERAAMGMPLNPDPGAEDHFYDYRAAYDAGKLAIDESGHFPSEFKLEGHPRMVVDGVNTKTGEIAGLLGEGEIGMTERITQDDMVEDLLGSHENYIRHPRTGETVRRGQAPWRVLPATDSERMIRHPVSGKTVKAGPSPFKFLERE